MSLTPSIPDSAKVRAAIALRRQTVRSWAHQNRFPEKTVYAVLAGRRSGSRNPRLIAALNRLAT